MPGALLIGPDRFVLAAVWYVLLFAVWVAWEARERQRLV
jgi:hypothetical protein